MNKIRLFEKSISYLIFCLILIGAAVLPSVSAVNTQTFYAIHDGTENHAIQTNQEVEITIYGSLYMKEHKPLNFTDGLYAEFIYYGEGAIIINVSFSLKTMSTQPTSWNMMLIDNMELPSEATGMALISGVNFGIGLFSFTLILDGCGEFAGKHYETTAFGICVGYNAFIIFQK